MKLYGHPLSSCTRKVLLLLAEKNAHTELVVVDLFEGEHKSPGHLARHPFGVIPGLDDDGFRLFESRAILRYLDAHLPGASLTPAALRDRARMDQWLSVDQSYVAPHTRTLALERIVKKHVGKPADDAAVASASNALANALSVIDSTLAEVPYLAGASFSLADISLIPYVASLPMIGAADLAKALPSLSGWWRRVGERASVQALLAAA